MSDTTQRFGLRSLLLAALVLVALSLAFTQVSALGQTPTAQPSSNPAPPAQAQNPAPSSTVGELVLTTGQDSITVPVYAFSHGASNNATAHTAGGGGAGKPNFQDLTLTIAAGTDSPALLEFLATGVHLDRAELDIPFPDGTPATYELEDVLVTSISEGDSGGQELRYENISLNYRVVTKTVGAESFSFDTVEGVVPTP